jgi:methyl-accepting chemotaxis protein
VLKTQSQSIAEIARSVESVASLSERTNAAVKQNTQATDDLNVMAIELQRQLDYFKVSA